MNLTFLLRCVTYRSNWRLQAVLVRYNVLAIVELMAKQILYTTVNTR